MPPKKAKKAKTKVGAPSGLVYNPNREFIIERILGRRFRGGKKEYLIQWEGYPGTYNSWEPEKGLVSIQDWMEQFDRAEERKKNQELEAKKRSSSTPAGGNKRGLEEASASSYNGTRGRQAGKKLKLRVEQVDEVPQTGNDAQLMTNDEDQFLFGHDGNLTIPSDSESGTSFMTTLTTESDSESASQADQVLPLADDEQSDRADLDAESVIEEVTEKNPVDIMDMPVLTPAIFSSTDNGIKQKDDRNLPSVDNGIAANAAIMQELSNLKAELQGKDKDIDDLKLKVKSANEESSLMLNKVVELKNELDRVLQERSELEELVIERNAKIQELKSQNENLVKDCNELEVIRGRLLFENNLKHRSIKSVYSLKIKLAKSETLLGKSRTQLTTQNMEHEHEIRALTEKYSQLETDKADLQISLAVTKEETGALVQENSQLQAENAELENILVVTKQDRIRLGKSLAEKRERNERLYERVKKAKSETKLSQEQNAWLEEKFEKLDAKCSELLRIIQDQATNLDHNDHDHEDCKYKKKRANAEN